MDETDPRLFYLPLPRQRQPTVGGVFLNASTINTREAGDQRVWSQPTPARCNLTPEDEAYAELWGGQVGIELLRENREAAHAIVDRAIDARKREKSGPLLQTLLTQVGVETRAANTLERDFDIRTVGEFLSADIPTLLARKHFGDTTLMSTMQALLRYTVNELLNRET